MAYLVPKVLINQEFTQLPVFADAPLAALVFGPQYELHRYSVAAEKVSTAVTHPDSPELKNAYQVDSDVVYAFPNQTSGTFVDASFVKVNIDNARVEYLPTTLSSGADLTITRVAHPTIGGQYYTNRFETAITLTTANDNSRNGAFSSRDVSPGDYIVIRDVDASVNSTVRVKALYPTVVASEVATPGTGDSANIQTQSEVTSALLAYAGTNTTPTDEPITVSSGRSYKGYVAKRVLADTYAIEVTTGGDLTTAVFKVTSVNGAFTARTGLTLDGSDILIIDDVGTNLLKIDFSGITRSSGTLLQVGDKWTFAAVAPVTTRTPTVAGTYSGPEDAVYKLKVVRGGPFYTGSNSDVCARIAVTSDGNDSSPAVNVTSATPFQVGSYGVTGTFSAATAGGGLILGDIYYVTATAATDGAVTIVETFEKLPATLISGANDFDIVSMQLPANVSVPAVDPSDDNLINWVVDDIAQSITINQDITTTADSFTHPGGDPMLLNILSGDIYVTHRDLVIDHAISIGSVTAEDQVSAILGTIDPDNPLAQGVYDAALNSNGAPVYFSGVLSNDLEGYEGVLANARKHEYYYGLVPLTFDRTIQDAVVSHVNAMSTAESAKWRVAWLSLPVTEKTLVYDKKDNGQAWKATITDDTFATGTQYTLVTIAGATLISDGVRPTDNLLINFAKTSAGDVVYDTFEIIDVRTEETLVLASGPATPINVALKAQIERVYTKDEQIDILSRQGGDFNNRRVRTVFPPKVKNNGVDKDGFYVAAALAGLRAGVVPHQGLTNTVLLGFTDLDMVVNTYTDIQLNRLAEQGIWIVTQSTLGATPYVRHQLTTDTSNLNTSEDSITTNVDSISYGMHRALAPYIGIYNIHPNAINSVRSTIFGELSYRLTNTYTERAGNQLNSFEIVTLEQSPTFKDRIVAVIKLGVPYPLNFIDLTFVI